MNISNSEATKKRTAGSAQRHSGRGNSKRARGSFIPIVRSGASHSSASHEDMAQSSEIRSYNMYTLPGGRVGAQRQDVRIELTISDILRK